MHLKLQEEATLRSSVTHSEYDCPGFIIVLKHSLYQDDKTSKLDAKLLMQITH